MTTALPARWLSIESSTLQLSVACTTDDGRLVTRTVHETTHARVLLGLVQDVLAEAGVARPERLLAGVGPGSFTALRIGLAAAKGLAMGWGLPIVAVPSARAFAGALPGTEAVALAWDARKGEVYGGLFVPGVFAPALLDVMTATPEVFRERLALAAGQTPYRRAGDGWARYADALLGEGASLDAIEVAWPDAVANLQWAAAHELATQPAGTVEPLYFRASDAELGGPRPHRVLRDGPQPLPPRPAR
jgi:tRNA threonylcarbamoyladenosine biosynthesis protein TsaB